MKNKYIFPILGAIIGVLFSLWDALISYGDTAPPDELIIKTFKNAISNYFLNKNTLIYIFIGVGLRQLLCFFCKNIQKNK